MPLVGGGVPAAGPLAPILGPPANMTTEDLASGPTFAWTYVPGTSGATQSAYAFSRSVSGSSSPLYWNVGTTAWQSAIVYNSGSADSITFPSASWGNGVSYSWSVSCQDTNGFGPFATPFTVVGSGTLTTTVNTPSGTISTSQPTVSWSVSYPTGGVSQTGFRVVIYNSTQYGAGGFTPGSGPSVYDSTVVGSTATSVPLTSPPAPGPTNPVFLPGATSYRAYVLVYATGGQTAPWAHSSFAVSFTAPDTPTIVATASTDPTTGAPAIELVVTGSLYMSVIPMCIILRSDGNYVRGASPANPAQLNGSYMVTIYDEEILQGVTYTYEAFLVVTV